MIKICLSVFLTLTLSITYAQKQINKYVDNNGVAHLLAQTVEELTPNSTALVLKDNFTTLPDRIFDFPQLKVLILKGNKLKILPDKISLLKNLEELDLSDNQLVVLNKSISELKELRVLDVSNNSLYSLPKGFENLNKLRELRLSKTWIMQVPKQNFENLEVLHLGTPLNDSLMVNAKNLRELLILDPFFRLEKLPKLSVKESPNLFKLSKIQSLTLDCTNRNIEGKDICNFTLLKNLKLINPADDRNMLSKNLGKADVINFGKKITAKLHNCLPNCKIEIEFKPLEMPEHKISSFLRNPDSHFLKEYETEYYKNQINAKAKDKLIKTYCLATQAQLSINEIEAAAIFLHKAEQLEPNEPEVIRVKSFLLIYQGKLEEAKVLLPLIKSEHSSKMDMEYFLSKITIENITPEETKKLLEEFKSFW